MPFSNEICPGVIFQGFIEPPLPPDPPLCLCPSWLIFSRDPNLNPKAPGNYRSTSYAVPVMCGSQCLSLNPISTDLCDSELLRGKIVYKMILVLFIDMPTTNIFD